MIYLGFFAVFLAGLQVGLTIAKLCIDAEKRVNPPAKSLFDYHPKVD